MKYINYKKNYFITIITQLELEIKDLKKKLNKKINITKEQDLEHLNKLQIILQEYYKKYYELNNKE